MQVNPTAATPQTGESSGLGIDLRRFPWVKRLAADSLDIVIRENGPAPAAEALRVATQLAGAV